MGLHCFFQLFSGPRISGRLYSWLILHDEKFSVAVVFKASENDRGPGGLRLLSVESAGERVQTEVQPEFAT